MKSLKFPIRGSPQFIELQKSLATKEFLSLQEIACYLNISIQTVYKHTSKKTWPVYKPGHKLIMVRRDDIDEWIKQSGKRRLEKGKSLNNYFLRKQNL